MDLTREQLLHHPSTVLKDQGDGAPRLVRFDLDDGSVVLKEWRPSGRFMAWWARKVLSREVHHYRLLDGVRGIPRLRGEFGPASFAIDAVAGAAAVRRQVPSHVLEQGLDSLEEVLAELHRRRFVHLDLHQRRNVLIDENGQAWVIDLGQGLDCRRGWLRRALFPLLARIDRHAILKFRSRYLPRTLPEGTSSRYGERSMRRWLKPVRRAVRRLAGGG